MQDQMDAIDGAGLAEKAAEKVEASTAESAASDSLHSEQSQASLDAALFAGADKLLALLGARRQALRDEREAQADKVSLVRRAIKIVQLKPKIEQLELAELLGVKLRELDAVLAWAEEQDLVARFEPAEQDMRKVAVMAAEDALERLDDAASVFGPLVPGLAVDREELLVSVLDEANAALEALGLEAPTERHGESRPHDRGGRGYAGRDDGYRHHAGNSGNRSSRGRGEDRGYGAPHRDRGARKSGGDHRPYGGRNHDGYRGGDHYHRGHGGNPRGSYHSGH